MKCMNLVSATLDVVGALMVRAPSAETVLIASARRQLA